MVNMVIMITTVMMMKTKWMTKRPTRWRRSYSAFSYIFWLVSLSDLTSSKKKKKMMREIFSFSYRVSDVT